MKTWMEEYGLIVVAAIVIMLFVVAATPVGHALTKSCVNVVEKVAAEMHEGFDKAEQGTEDEEEVETLKDGVLWGYGSTFIEKDVWGNDPNFFFQGMSPDVTPGQPSGNWDPPYAKVSNSIMNPEDLIGSKVTMYNGQSEVTLHTIRDIDIADCGDYFIVHCGNTAKEIWVVNNSFDVFTPGIYCDQNGLGTTLQNLANVEGSYIKFVK